MGEGWRVQAIKVEAPRLPLYTKSRRRWWTPPSTLLVADSSSRLLSYRVDVSQGTILEMPPSPGACLAFLLAKSSMQRTSG